MKHPSGSLKPFFLILLSLLIVCATDITAQPVYGMATLFDYNADGTRKERRTEPYTIISPKPGRGGEPLDTLTQEFDKNLLNTTNEILVRAYPNPVTNMLVVENLSWDGTNNIVIKLYDITGKHLLTKTTTSAKEQIPFSNYPPGTYHVHYYLNEKLLTDWKIIKNN